LRKVEEKLADRLDSGRQGNMRGYFSTYVGNREKNVERNAYLCSICRFREGFSILMMADKLRNICFVQGLYSDRIQKTVRSRNHQNFHEIAETALQEEGSIISNFEKYMKTGRKYSSIKCRNCGKGHIIAKCSRKERKDIRVIQFADEGRTPHTRNIEITGYNCGQKGHISRNCKRQTNFREMRPVIEGKDSENESRLSQNSG
jgi:hypothetical protein